MISAVTPCGASMFCVRCAHEQGTWKPSGLLSRFVKYGFEALVGVWTVKWVEEAEPSGRGGESGVRAAPSATGSGSPPLSSKRPDRAIVSFLAPSLWLYYRYYVRSQQTDACGRSFGKSHGPQARFLCRA